MRLNAKSLSLTVPSEDRTSIARPVCVGDKSNIHWSTEFSLVVSTCSLIVGRVASLVQVSDGQCAAPQIHQLLYLCSRGTHISIQWLTEDSLVVHVHSLWEW